MHPPCRGAPAGPPWAAPGGVALNCASDASLLQLYFSVMSLTLPYLMWNQIVSLAEQEEVSRAEGSEAEEQRQ